MIKMIFTQAQVIARLEAGPDGPYLDWLASALYDTTDTIREYLITADAFGRWLTQQGLAIRG